MSPSRVAAPRRKKAISRASKGRPWMGGRVVSQICTRFGTQLRREGDHGPLNGEAVHTITLPSCAGWMSTRYSTKGASLRIPLPGTAPVVSATCRRRATFTNGQLAPGDAEADARGMSVISTFGFKRPDTARAVDREREALAI